MIAQVYFNLHRRCWSIRSSVTHRVINKLEPPRYLVILTDVTFKVNETGRQRVIRERRKNVHSFACGTLVDPQTAVGRFKECVVPLSYNPYKAGHFIRTDTGEAVYACKLLLMSTKLVEIITEGGLPTGKLKRIPRVLAKL